MLEYILEYVLRSFCWIGASVACSRECLQKTFAAKKKTHTSAGCCSRHTYNDMLYVEHETLVDNPSSIVNYSRPSEILSRGLRWNIPRWGTQETIWIRFCAIYRSYTKSSYYLILRSHPTCASGRHFHTSNVDGLWRSSSIIIGIPVASAWRLHFRRFRGFEYWRRRWRAYGECSPRPAEWEPNEKEKQYFFCLRGAYMPFSFRCGIDCDINIYINYLLSVTQLYWILFDKGNQCWPVYLLAFLRARTCLCFLFRLNRCAHILVSVKILIRLNLMIT